MLISKNTIPMLSLSILLAGVTASVEASFTAVGVYDENTTQSNTVDTIATSDANTNQLSLSSFTTLVANAFSSGQGGVVNFDSGSLNGSATIGGTVPYSDNFDVLFDGGSKSLHVFDGSVTNPGSSPANTSGDYAGPGAFSGRTPISGSQFLVQSVNADFVFNLGTITGGDPGEVVTAIGGTILSRDYSVFSSGVSVTATVTFTDNTTASAVSTLSQGNGTDDTFFGFTAPSGLGITKFIIDLSNNAAYTGMDDLAFVTSVIVPEPGSISLLAAASLALMRRRRSRRATLCHR
ncbi:PEP-CTERM sorting domain-containing protein [Planctomycetales bacterium ZRK34]|nr:PEP-CTERM sorting domain-containing protein [Planctomycetales bacterium ZRK34]